MAQLFQVSDGKCWVRWTKKIFSSHGDIYGVIYGSILLVVRVFIFFVLCLFLFMWPYITYVGGKGGGGGEGFCEGH